MNQQALNTALASLVAARSLGSRVDLEDLIASAILTSGFEPSQLGPELARLMREFAERAGVTVTSSSTEARTAVESYFLENPPDAPLSLAIAQLLRELLLDTAADDREAMYVRLTDEGERSECASPPEALHPEGASSLGPLAYFIARKRLSDAD
jgi:hypothetical protein